MQYITPQSERHFRPSIRSAPLLSSPIRDAGIHVSSEPIDSLHVSVSLVVVQSVCLSVWRYSPAAGLQQAVPNLQGGHAEVCYPDVVLLIQQQILWLQVPVAVGQMNGEDCETKVDFFS